MLLQEINRATNQPTDQAAHDLVRHILSPAKQELQVKCSNLTLYSKQCCYPTHAHRTSAFQVHFAHENKNKHCHQLFRSPKENIGGHKILIHYVQ